MDWKNAIIKWIFRNVKVETERLKKIVEAADMDSDGFVDLGEFVQLLNAYRKELSR